MDEKLLLNVYLPAACRTYEFRVPLCLTVAEAAALIAHILEEREPALYRAQGGAALAVIDHASGMRGGLLLPDERIHTLVVRGDLVNGSRVALV